MPHLTEQRKEELVPKIINILAYQQSITNQGINYSGEKDWALNKILALFETELAQALTNKVEEIRGEIENNKFSLNIDWYLPKVKAWNKSNYDIPFDDGYGKAKYDVLALPALQLPTNNNRDE